MNFKVTDVGRELTREIGLRLRDEREKRQLTLKDMSLLLNGLFSPSRISNYEQGLRRLGLEEAMIISHYFGVNPAYLLGLDMSQSVASDFLKDKQVPVDDRKANTQLRRRSDANLLLGDG